MSRKQHHRTATTHDEDCPCYGDDIEHSMDCRNCECSNLCEVCNAPMDDGKLHNIPGNNTELCSHIRGM